MPVLSRATPTKDCLREYQKFAIFGGMESIKSLISKVQERRGDWPRLAQASAVSYSWLVKFAGKKIENPRIQTVERLSKALQSPSPAPTPRGPLPD